MFQVTTICSPIARPLKAFIGSRPRRQQVSGCRLPISSIFCRLYSPSKVTCCGGSICTGSSAANSRANARRAGLSFLSGSVDMDHLLHPKIGSTIEPLPGVRFSQERLRSWTKRRDDCTPMLLQRRRRKSPNGCHTFLVWAPAPHAENTSKSPRRLQRSTDGQHRSLSCA